MEHTEQETSVDPNYLNGFNRGYLLARFEPELAAKLTSQPNNSNAFFKGLVGGKNEYDREVQDWAKGFSKGSPARDERENGKER